jgi:CubicO group peptidase (beta-lactamase class C family)
MTSCPKEARLRRRLLRGSKTVALLLVGLLLVSCEPSNAAFAQTMSAVDGFMADHLVAGAGVAVIQRGDLIEVAHGVEDIETEQPVTEDTRFRVASVTKMYISAIALRLVDQGALVLDEPIGERVPLPESLHHAKSFTLRQLLSHTTGLPQTFTDDADRGRLLTLEDRMERIPPPVCPPGECWSYADGNYVIVEALLEATTGQPIAEVFDEQIVVPLDLTNTAVMDPSTSPEPLPAQYALVHDEADQAPVEPLRLFKQTLPLVPTLVTTATDAARFADALFSGEVLRPATLETMLDTSVMRDLPCRNEAFDGCPFEYGLGVFHYDIGGRHLVGHDGGSGAIVAHDQTDGLTVAILSNGGEQDVGRFIESILDAIDS